MIDNFRLLGPALVMIVSLSNRQLNAGFATSFLSPGSHLLLMPTY